MARHDTSILPFDFETHAESLIRYLQTTLPSDYQDFLEDNAARPLVDSISYEMALLTYMFNAGMKQLFLPTATTRQAMYLLGKLVNYDLGGPTASLVVLTFRLSLVHGSNVVIPAGTQVQTPGSSPVVFETIANATIIAGQLSVDVLAQQGQTVTEIIGTTATDTTPNQQFRSTRPPLLASISVTINDVVWTSVDNIFDLASGERGFTVKPDARGFAVITFGNGIFGAIPPAYADVYLTYRVGGGRNTNIGHGGITELNTTITDVLGQIVTVSVTNAVAAYGGQDSETIEEARINIPRSVRSMDRFVSREDFQTLPSVFSDPQLGSIFKSSATVKYAWATHIVTILILMAPADGFLMPPRIPSQAMLDAVRQYVEERTLPTMGISVEAARLRTADLTVNVYYFPNYREETVRANIRKGLQNIFNYSTRQIGDGLRLSDIHAALDTQPGVDYVDIILPSGNVSILADEFLILGTVTIQFIRETTLQS